MSKKDGKSVIRKEVGLLFPIRKLSEYYNYEVIIHEYSQSLKVKHSRSNQGRKTYVPFSPPCFTVPEPSAQR